jgi:hypothetical protein
VETLILITCLIHNTYTYTHTQTQSYGVEFRVKLTREI